MTHIPRSGDLDLGLALALEGYPALGRRRATLGSYVFRSRLLLRPVVVMGGEAAVRFFYAPGAFTRRGAMPSRVVKLLQGERSVQTLDGEAHRVRKAMFLRMMEPASLDTLRRQFADRWAARSRAWRVGETVVLFDEVRAILCATACDWSGIPEDRYDLDALTGDLSAMIENVGAFGWAYRRARRRRKASEAWAGDIVAEARTGRLAPSPDSALAIIAAHRDADGRELDRAVAGIELLNVLRPIVAVARYIVFAVHALQRNSAASRSLSTLQNASLEAFAQEVRRSYPFFPAIGGYALRDLKWDGHTIAKGTWVLLDLHGTNHDPQIWPDPDTFRFDRFIDWDGDPYRLVPQGGGHVETGHRCPGDRVVVELIKVAVSQLLRAELEFPAQNLSIDMTAMPTLPRSGVVLRKRSSGTPEHMIV